MRQNFFAHPVNEYDVPTAKAVHIASPNASASVFEFSIESGAVRSTECVALVFAVCSGESLKMVA